MAGRTYQKAEDPNDPAGLVSTAFVTAIGREPRADELARGVKFLQDQAEIISGRDLPTSLPVPMPEGPTPAQASAMVDFCHALLNLNEFVFVD